MIKKSVLKVKDWQRGIFISGIFLFFLIYSSQTKVSYPIINELKKIKYFQVSLTLPIFAAIILFTTVDILLKKYFKIIFSRTSTIIQIILSAILFYYYCHYFFNLPMIFSLLVLLEDLYKNAYDIKVKYEEVFISNYSIDLKYKNILGPISLLYFILNYLGLYFYFNRNFYNSLLFLIFFQNYGNTILSSYYGIKNILIEQKIFTRKFYFNYAHKLLFCGIFSIFLHNFAAAVPLQLTNVFFVLFSVDCNNQTTLLLFYAFFYNFFASISRIRLPYTIINNISYGDAGGINNHLKYTDFLMPYLICESKINLYFSIFAGIYCISSYEFFKYLNYAHNIIFIHVFIGALVFNYLLNVRIAPLLYKSMSN